MNGFLEAERILLSQKGKSVDKSGSCAVVLIVIDNKAYIAN